MTKQYTIEQKHKFGFFIPRTQIYIRKTHEELSYDLFQRKLIYVNYTLTRSEHRKINKDRESKELYKYKFAFLLRNIWSIYM